MESMAIAHPRFFHYILIAHFKILIAHLIFNLATAIAWYNPTGLRTVGLYLILTWPTDLMPMTPKSKKVRPPLE